MTGREKYKLRTLPKKINFQRAVKSAVKIVYNHREFEHILDLLGYFVGVTLLLLGLFCFVRFIFILSLLLLL